MKKILILGVSLFVSGCVHFAPQTATSENYKQMLDSWLGRPKDELIAVWGMPTHDYLRQNKNYVIYVRSRMGDVASGETIERMPQSSKEHFLTKDGGVVSKVCNTVFTVVDNRVETWKFDGNDCLAYSDEYGY